MTELTDRFPRLKAYLDSLSGAGVPGCDLIVCRDHEPIFRHMAGWRDAEMTQPMCGDETYWLYSCTKVFTTCAAMQLIGAGKLSLDDPVSKWLPAYTELKVRDGDTVRPAERVMTVRHLMSMQSGLDYNMDRASICGVLEETGHKATTRQIVDALAADPLCFEPGTDFLYSLSHDVLAAVIEAVTGMRFSGYLKKHIFEPLGLETMAFRLTDAAAERLCAAYEMAEGGRKLLPQDPNNYRMSENYESGGAGLLGDVRDCALLMDAMACGGQGRSGAAILPPEMIQLWRANQLGPKSRATFDAWRRLGYSYGLGVRTRVDLEKGGAGAIGEFGWDGAAGAWAMIDPEHHLSAFYAMHVRNFGYCYDVIHPRIRSLIYEELGIT